MKKRIKFDRLSTIEQRKTAIANAMASVMPFHLKHMVLILEGGMQTEYTGGSSQMLLARGMTIEFENA